MDLTQGTQNEKNDKAKKMMLWFGIVSLLMAFAGLTSAYIVSRSMRNDWAGDIELPSAFYFSTLTILLSSITYILATRAVKFSKGKEGVHWLWATLILGAAFIVLQLLGFSQMVSQGYYFTGPTSNIKISYIFLIAALHFAHVLAGIISLVVVLYNQSKGKYTATKMLGLSLGATFWHFLDLLWVYLLLFMMFVK